MNLNINCESIEITPINRAVINVNITDIDEDETLSHFDITQIIKYFGSDKLLDEIGLTEVKDYFDLHED